MKKWMSLLLIALLTVSLLSGCKTTPQEEEGAVADNWIGVETGDGEEDPEDDLSGKEETPSDTKDPQDSKEPEGGNNEPSEDTKEPDDPAKEPTGGNTASSEDTKEPNDTKDPEDTAKEPDAITKEQSGVAITLMTQNLRTSGTQVGTYEERSAGDHNLWHRFRRLKSQVRNWEPDVIMTQEGMSGHVNLLTTEAYFDQNYDIVWKNRGPNNDESIVDDQSVPVLYKTARFTLVDSGHFWLSDTPKVPSIGYGATEEYARITTWVRLKEKTSGVEFYVYSAHFAVTDVFHIKAMEQYMSEFDKLKDGVYAFVGGDFNLRYKSNEYNVMLEWDRVIDLKDMALNMAEDGLAEIGGNTGTVHSRYDKKNGVQDEWAEGEEDVAPYGDLRQIDHIFAKPDPHMAVDFWGVDYTTYGYDENGETVKKGYHSDHYGVVAKVRLDTDVDYSRYQEQNPDSEAL